MAQGRKKLQRQKKGPWSLEERRVKAPCWAGGGRRGGERCWHAARTESLLGLLSEGLLGVEISEEVPEEDPDEIFISSPGAYFQDHGVY